MLKKGDKTRQFIIAEAKKLFAKKGYTAVTMKDVCEICDLSRGGLYRYFGSTKEIFLEILNEDKEDKGELLLKDIKKGGSALHMFKWFLEDRKNTLILGEYKGFSFAVREFTQQEHEQRSYLRKRLEQAKQGLMLLLEHGQKQGEFRTFDNESMALTILLLLDSLEINAYILGFTKEQVNEQLGFLSQLIEK